MLRHLQTAALGPTASSPCRETEEQDLKTLSRGALLDPQERGSKGEDTYSMR